MLVFVIIDDVLEDSGTGFTAINPRNVITLHFNSSEITRVYRSYFDLYFFVVVNFLAHVNSLEHFRRLLTMNGSFFNDFVRRVAFLGCICDQKLRHDVFSTQVRA